MKKTAIVILFIVIVIFCLFSPLTIFGKVALSNFSAAKGKALYNSGRHNEAIAPLEDAIKIRRPHGEAHYYLALTYEGLGERERAANLLESYLDYVKQTNEWLGSMDRVNINKCKRLLNRLK